MAKTFKEKKEERRKEREAVTAERRKVKRTLSRGIQIKVR